MAKATKEAPPAKSKTPAAKPAPAPAKKAKTASPLVADKNGDFPFILYSVKAKQFVDMATKPKAQLSPTGKGAWMCKGFDNEGNRLTMIVGNATAENWAKRKLAEYVD